MTTRQFSTVTAISILAPTFALGSMTLPDESIQASARVLGELTEDPDDWDPNGWELEGDLPIPIGVVVEDPETAESSSGGGWQIDSHEEWEHVGESHPDASSKEDSEFDVGEHLDEEGNWDPPHLPDPGGNAYNLEAEAYYWKATIEGFAFDTDVLTAANTGQIKAAAGVTTTCTNTSDYEGTMHVTHNVEAHASVRLNCFPESGPYIVAPDAAGVVGAESLGEDSIGGSLHATASVNKFSTGTSLATVILNSFSEGKPKFEIPSSETGSENGEYSDDGPFGPNQESNTKKGDSLTVHEACRVVGELKADGGGLSLPPSGTYLARAYVGLEGESTSVARLRLGLIIPVNGVPDDEDSPEEGQ